MNKRIFVISGPSGVGKSTLLKMLLGEFGDIAAGTVSHTTREIRPGEIDGREYYFTTRINFTSMIDNGLFIEYVQYCGNYYGSSTLTIKTILQKFNACIMDLEWDGAYKMLHGCNIDNVPKIGILILPPSIQSLLRRLENRNTEDCATMKCRMCNSFNANKVANYKYIIVNKDIKTAYAQIRKIFVNEMLHNT